MTRRSSAFRSAVFILLAWLATVGVFAVLAARVAIDRATDEVNATGFVLHRVISQRVAQHDAHLTSLAALVMAADPPPEDALRQVAQSIMRFYPRVEAIDILALSLGGGVQTILATAQGTPRTLMPEFARAIFEQRPSEVRAYLDARAPARYFLGKRTGSPDRRLAIIVEINPALLVEADERPAWARLVLALDGHVLVDRPAAHGADSPAWLSIPSFSRAVDSQSQPLLLSLQRPLTLSDILYPKLTLGFAAFALFVLLAAVYGWRLRRDARRAHDAAMRAEQRTQMLEHETRLAHASRVNALGELASGIAHELTQPLTALLSQSQAAVRLAASGEDLDLLNQPLAANVREAKRAGEMLKRMRNYIRKGDTQKVPTDLNQVARDICDLMRADLAGRGIALALDLAPLPLQALADPIEMEQVLHNLIRNAADSLHAAKSQEKRITVETALDGWHAVIRVRDTGPGIAPEVLVRLFEPFFTTKPDGMGLGLSLCETIVERTGGGISAGNGQGGGACFTITLPASSAAQQAAQ